MANEEKESLRDIAMSIDSHFKLENKNYCLLKAVGRVRCSIENNGVTSDKNFWIITHESHKLKQQRFNFVGDRENVSDARISAPEDKLNTNVSRDKHECMRFFEAIGSVKEYPLISQCGKPKSFKLKLMLSFRHYEFSSITLCGDIMQGLTDNGIDDWEELRRFVLPQMESVSLKVSYRQTPTLLDIARDMYKLDRGEYPTYKSERVKSEFEPIPLIVISDDDEEKARWIADRIVDIYVNYDNELPSIAIFVDDTQDIGRLKRLLEEYLEDRVDVTDCSGGDIDTKDTVRIFRISQVKGMEFEAVFFYDIDKAVAEDPDLARRYLYVGISRAASHLAATISDVEGFDSLIDYFSDDEDAWRR